MRTLCLALIFLCSAAAEPQSWSGLREVNPPAAPPPDSLVAIVGATLIDGRGGEPLADSAVLVRGARIAAAGERADLEIPPEAERIDAAGQFLLPGMLDAHFHTQSPDRLDGLLGAGFTAFRDPGRPISVYHERFLAPDRPQPRAFLTGPHFDQKPHAYPKNAVELLTPDEVRREMERLHEAGASAVKIYYRLPLDLIAVAGEQADEYGIPVTAHLELVPADEAIRAGLDGVEHVTSLGTALADPADAREFERRVREDNAARRPGRYWLWNRLELEDNPKVAALLQLMRERGVYLVPTLRPFEVQAGDDEATPETLGGFAKMQEFTRLAFRAGVPVVASSHGPTPDANWRELELLVDAGLTPAEALHAALLPAARFFGAAGRLGSIEAGKAADLVLLDENPLESVKALRAVSRVMLNGVWQD